MIYLQCRIYRCITTKTISIWSNESDIHSKHDIKMFITKHLASRSIKKQEISTPTISRFIWHFHMMKGLFLHILYIRYVYISLLHPGVLKVLSACKDNFCKDAASSVAVLVFRTLDLGSMYHSACQRLGSKVPMSWKTAKYKSMPWNYRKIEWNFDN